MSQPAPRPPARDPSSFYRLNEELAAELARLEASGVLAPLQELLRAGGQELLVASVRRAEGLEELIGVLGPQRAAREVAAPGPLPPAAARDPDAACDCGPQDGAPRPAAPPARGGWDSESVLAARSRFTVVLASGEPRELYMPDHVCPACLNELGNWIEHCDRACAACDYRW